MFKNKWVTVKSSLAVCGIIGHFLSVDLETITMTVTLGKIQTTVDGGWLVSLEVPQSDAQSVMKLSECRDMNLQLVVVPMAFE
jgi:hypothetical protein